MKRGYLFSTLPGLLLAVGVGSATANPSAEAIGGCAGHYYLNASTGKSWASGPGGAIPFLAGDVYNNTNPPGTPNFGISSTDFASTWGDRVTTTGTGTLAENDFTLYNSQSSAGSVLTATFNIGLFDGASNALLGGYTTGVFNFTATPLPPGFFAILTVTGLTGLNINLSTTDVLMTQQLATVTGTATRLGVASLDPPTIGSSTNTMYINSSTIGPAGFYTIGTPPLNANPGYRINRTTPLSTESKNWGAVKNLYR